MKTKMKSKLFAMLLSLIMIVAVMPSQAFAATSYKFVIVLSGTGSGNVSVYKELRTGGWSFVGEGEHIESDVRLKIKATPDKYSDIDNNNVAISTSDLIGNTFLAGDESLPTPLIFAEDENREIIKGEFIYDPSRLSSKYDTWKHADKAIVIDFKNINTDTISIEGKKLGEGRLSLYLKDGWKLTPAKRARERDTIVVSAEPKSGWTLSGLYLLKKDEAEPSPPYAITGDFSVFPYNDEMYQVTMPYYDAKVYAVFTSGDTPGEKHTVTVSGIKAGDKTYDGKTDATLDCSEAVVNGLQDGDSVTVSAKGAFADSSAGDNKIVEIKEITLQGDEQGKYEIDLANSQKEARGNIKKANPAVTGVSVTAPATVYETTAIGDIVLSFTADPGGGSIELDDGQTLTVGTKDYNWTYTPAPADIANYNNATGRVSITVEKAEQTVYNISYKLNGGSNHPDNPVTYTTDTNTITLKDASHSIMTFDGWYDAAGNRVTTIASGITGNLSLEARWSANITDTAFGVNLSETSYSYNGASQLPAVTVAGPAGNLTEGTDYTVTPPSDTKSIGEKTIAITGTNTYNAVGTRYTGSRTATYQIVEGNQTIQIDTSNLTDLRYIGTPFTIMLALSQSGTGSGNVNWTSSDPSVLSIDGTTATILNTGTVTLTATKEADGNYKEATDEVMVTIHKGKAPTITFPRAQSITYGQTLADSRLTGGSTEYGTFAWEKPSTVPAAGTGLFYVIFTPYPETEQYYEPIPEAVKRQPVEVTMHQQTPALTLTATKGDNAATLTATLTTAGQGDAPSRTVMFEYSEDNGSTWTTVPSGNAVALASGTGTATLVWNYPHSDREYQLRATYSGDFNYKTANGNTTFDPRKEDQNSFEVRASSTQVTYGEALTFTIANEKGTGAVTYDVSDTSVMTVDANGNATILKYGIVTVTATKAGDNDYNAASAAISVTVKKAKLTFSAEDKTVKQGDPMPTLTFVTTGLVNGDTVSGTPILTTSVTNTDNTGDFTISISGGTVVTKSGAVWRDCYEAVYEKGRLTINAPVTVTEITLNSDGAKKIYTEGEALDVTGLTLEVSKSDGSKETVDVTASMVNGFDSSKLGKQTLTVTYESFDATYQIEVKAKVAVSYAAKDSSGNTIQSVTWQKGSGKNLDLTFKRSEDDHLTYGLFGSLEIGGQAVGSANYDKAEGSLKLSIKPEYLETLSVGDYTVKVNFQDGSATVKLTVLAASAQPTPSPTPKPSEKPTSPKTGDESNLALWSSLMFLSLAGLLAVAVNAKRRRKTR